MALNSIGNFAFLELVGVYQGVTARLEAIQREGVNGTAYWSLGFFGEAFQLQSRVDAFDRAHADTLYRGYCSLIAAGPVPVFYYGLPLAADSELFKVEAVVPIRIGQLLSCSGGLNPPSLGLCECVWTLRAIATN